jgi:hypothetical protein
VRLCADACRSLGYDTRAIDISAKHMQPMDLPQQIGANGHTHRGPGTVVLHVNAPLIPLTLWQLGAAFVKGKHIIGYWAWELERVPLDWHRGMTVVHQAWVPSRFTAEALRLPGTRLPIRVVPHPLAACPYSKSSGSKDPFRVLLIFNAASGFARKNPCAGIMAFRKPSMPTPQRSWSSNRPISISIPRGGPCSKPLSADNPTSVTSTMCCRRTSLTPFMT